MIILFPRISYIYGNYQSAIKNRHDTFVISTNMHSRLTYRGPFILYVSYFVLMALAVSLISLSFRVDNETVLFLQLLLTGILASIVSFSLILYSTQIDRKINTNQWRKSADTFYNDEGVFDYTHNGFTLITKEGKSLAIRWKDIIRIESHEDKKKQYLKIACIDIYFSEKDLITIDSTMPGFRLFEKRLKENMRDLWKTEVSYAGIEEEPRVKAQNIPSST